MHGRLCTGNGLTACDLCCARSMILKNTGSRTSVIQDVRKRVAYFFADDSIINELNGTRRIYAHWRLYRQQTWYDEVKADAEGEYTPLVSYRHRKAICSKWCFKTYYVDGAIHWKYLPFSEIIYYNEICFYQLSSS